MQWIWWNSVERLSWTMVGKTAGVGCKLSPVFDRKLIQSY